MAEYYPDGHTFQGLGYSSNQQPVSSDVTSSGTNDGSTTAGNLLQNLMHQCLDYHQQQTTEETKQPVHPASTQPQHQHEIPQQRKISLNSDIPSNSNHVPDTISFAAATQQPTSAPQRTGGDIHQFVQEGRSRANAILAKFQQLTRDHGIVEPAPLNPPVNVRFEDGLIPPDIIPPTCDFREKRETFLAKENQRKEAFLVKNFEYVSQREAHRYQQQLLQLNEAKQWEDQVQQQYQLALEERKRKLLGGQQQQQQQQKKQQQQQQQNMTTQAGIGTTKRKRVEKEKNRTGNVPLADHLDPTVSIYLSGLPVDGSIAEGFIGRLFSSYGTIKNVHFYRHKPTGELKGDGLLLFESKPKDKERLLQSVCSQMNGAELPCGSILQVEPADTGYSQKNAKYAPQSSGADPTTTTVINGAQLLQGKPEDRAKEEVQEEDSDLDDFFESLE